MPIFLCHRPSLSVDNSQAKLNPCRWSCLFLCATQATHANAFCCSSVNSALSWRCKLSKSSSLSFAISEQIRPQDSTASPKMVSPEASAPMTGPSASLLAPTCKMGLLRASCIAALDGMTTGSGGLSVGCGDGGGADPLRRGECARLTVRLLPVTDAALSKRSMLRTRRLGGACRIRSPSRGRTVTWRPRDSAGVLATRLPTGAADTTGTADTVPTGRAEPR